MRFCNDNLTVSKSKQGESVISDDEGDVPIIDITLHKHQGKYRKLFKIYSRL